MPEKIFLNQQPHFSSKLNSRDFINSETHKALATLGGWETPENLDVLALLSTSSPSSLPSLLSTPLSFLNNSVTLEVWPHSIGKMFCFITVIFYRIRFFSYSPPCTELFKAFPLFCELAPPFCTM